MWQPAFTSNPFRENKPVHFLLRVTSCMWPQSHWMICWANQMLPFDISGTQSPSTLLLIVVWLSLALILTAVIKTTVNYCFHCKSIGSCHGDMALKRWDFYWEGNHSKLTLLHGCGHFALFRLIISVLLQFTCNLFTACVNTFNFSPTSLSRGSC